VYGSGASHSFKVWAGVPRRSHREPAYVNARPRPLALYYFGSSATNRTKVLTRTTSGNVTVNGTLMHYAERFDVAVVAVGVNDVTGRVSTARWTQELDRLVTLLSNRFEVRHVFLSHLPPLHEFPALPEPLRGYLGRRAQELNESLSEFALARDERSLVEPPPVKAAGLMAADGFHPGPSIYAAWADSTAAAIHARRNGPEARREAIRPDVTDALPIARPAPRNDRSRR
jgi:lysophospholipase L1-like esterase